MLTSPGRRRRGCIRCMTLSPKQLRLQFDPHQARRPSPGPPQVLVQVRLSLVSVRPARPARPRSCPAVPVDGGPRWPRRSVRSTTQGCVRVASTARNPVVGEDACPGFRQTGFVLKSVPVPILGAWQPGQGRQLSSLPRCSSAPAPTLTTASDIARSQPRAAPRCSDRRRASAGVRRLRKSNRRKRPTTSHHTLPRGMSCPACSHHAEVFVGGETQLNRGAPNCN